MALTVGELNGILSVDDRAVGPALRRAEEAMRASGQRMGNDADRAGQQSGEQLGEGIIRGADGRLRNARGRFVTAGRQAGDAVGDGLADAAGDGADDAVQATESRLDRLKTAAVGVGLAAGAVLMEAFGQALEQGKITAHLGASMGKTPAEAQRYGKIAGQLYADAVTEDFQGAADVIGATMAAGLVPPDATNAQIKSIAANLHDLSSTFELDLGQAANAVGQIMKTGLAPNAKTAMDVMTRGMQVMGPRADDLADTFNEYSTIFRQLGISAGDATGILAQGMAAGARDTDIVADSLKELVLITQGGGKKVDEAYKKIGLSGKDMATAFSKGGPEAKRGLDQVFDGLRKVKDPADRSALAVALFGTKAEDMQKALFAIDPSKAANALGKVGGAADKMGASIRDNAATQIEQFRRHAMEKLVVFVGTRVIPGLTRLFGFVQEHSGAFKVAAAVITAVLVPALILMGVNATVAAGRTVAAWTMSGAAAVRGAAVQSLPVARVIGGWIAQGVAATVQGARVAGAWVMTGGRAVAGAAMQVLAGARVVAGWVLMGVQSLLQAGRMAAAWVIAMGPVGWVIAGIIGLVALIIANWDTVKRWTAAAWSWVVGKLVWAKDMMIAAFLNFTLIGLIIKHWSTIKEKTSSAWNALIGWLRGVPGMIYRAFLNWTLLGLIIKHWSSIKTATVNKAMEMVAWVRGLPGRISAGVGSLGSLLTQKGRDVITGLWNGISGMGGWLRGRIMSFARDTVSGSIKSALGISSPSKVTTAQGRWIARGLAVGLTGSAKQVKGAATKLADIVRDSLKPGKKRSRALSLVGSGTKRLTKLAGQEEKLAARMKAATKRVADQIKNRDKLAADVKKGVLDAANITQGDTGGWPQTAETILARLRSDRQAADRFAANLAQLRKKGVRSDLIAQIAQAGVAQGSSAAAALANASSSQIKAINREQAALVTAAGRAGSTAGNAMYGAGIAAAQGLVKGLQSQQKAIDRQMAAIAKSMSAAIRKALGIRSPSRVMAQVGAYTTEGLRQGIESGRSAVNRSMSSLVSTPTPGQLGLGAGGSAAVGGKTPRAIVEFRSSDSELDQLILKSARRSVKNVGRGDVQFAFGRSN